METKNFNILFKALMYLLVFTTPFLSTVHTVHAFQLDNSMSSQDEQAVNQLLAPLNKAYNTVRIAAIAIATIMFVIAGIIYITASGDVVKKEKAKNTISYIVAGLFVIVIAPTAVQYIVT